MKPLPFKAEFTPDDQMIVEIAILAYLMKHDRQLGVNEEINADVLTEICRDWLREHDPKSLWTARDFGLV